MTKAELLELIRRGGGSTLAFKREGVQAHDVARAVVAFVNMAGGTVLIGVEEGSVSGVTRDRRAWCVSRRISDHGFMQQHLEC